MTDRTMTIYKRIKELYDNARMNDSCFITQNYEWIIGKAVMEMIKDSLHDFVVVDRDLMTLTDTLMGIMVTIDYNHTQRIGLYKETSKLRELKKPEEQRKTVYVSPKWSAKDDYILGKMLENIRNYDGVGRGGFTYFKPKFPIDNREREVMSLYSKTISPVTIPPLNVGKATDSLAKLSKRLAEIQEIQDRARNKYKAPQIDRVIYNNPATIVFWKDGTKTVVKAQDECFDEEKGLAMAIAKKVYGNEGNYYDKIKKHLPKIEKKPKKEHPAAEKGD